MRLALPLQAEHHMLPFVFAASRILPANPLAESTIKYQEGVSTQMLPLFAKRRSASPCKERARMYFGKEPEVAAAAHAGREEGWTGSVPKPAPLFCKGTSGLSKCPSAERKGVVGVPERLGAVRPSTGRKPGLVPGHAGKTWGFSLWKGVFLVFCRANHTQFRAQTLFCCAGG